MEKKIMITGAGGFVGGNLADLFSTKHKVVANYRNKKFIRKNKNISFNKSNLKKIRQFDKNIESLIHCASLTPPQYSQKRCFTENNKINNKVVEAIKKSKIKKIIFMSSVSVYPKNKLGVLRENSVLQNNELYGISKILMEKKLKKIANNNCKVVILRLSSVLGKKSHSNFLSNLILMFKNKKILKIHNKEKYFNSCIHVKNLYFLIKKILKKNLKSNFTIFNVHSSKPLKIFSIVKLYKKYLNKNKKIVFLNQKLPSYVVQSKNLKKYKLNVKSTKLNISMFLNDINNKYHYRIKKT